MATKDNPHSTTGTCNAAGCRVRCSLIQLRTCPLDPLALFELIWLVVMWQRNSVPILVTQHTTRVSNIGHCEFSVGQQRHQTCRSCTEGGEGGVWNDSTADFPQMSLQFWLRPGRGFHLNSWESWQTLSYDCSLQWSTKRISTFFPVHFFSFTIVFSWMFHTIINTVIYEN